MSKFFDTSKIKNFFAKYKKSLKMFALATVLVLASCPTLPVSATSQTVTNSELIRNGVQSATGDNVNFTKTAEAVSGMDGYVDITLSAQGPVEQIPIKEKVYVVVVFDRSTSMTQAPYGVTKYNNACNGAVDFSELVVENTDIEGYVSLVKFGNNANLERGFSRDALSSSICIPNESSGSIQYTNLQQSIAVAVQQLSTIESSRKYIVIMSDGVPTACQASGADTTNPPCYTTISQALPGASATTNRANNTTTPHVNYINSAIAMAEAGKAAGITFATIGYEVPVNSTAENTLKAIASGNYYWAASIAGIEEIFASIAPEITYLSAGKNAVATDIIGADFDFEHAITSNVSHNNGVVTCGLGNQMGEIIENGVSCTFRIKVKSFDICSSDTIDAWLATNDGASLSFNKYLYNETTQTSSLSTETSTINITQNPEYFYIAETFGDYATCAGQLNIKKRVINGREGFQLPENASFEFTVTINWTEGTPDSAKQYSLDGGATYEDYTGPFTVSVGQGETVNITVPNRFWVSSVQVIENQSGDYVLVTTSQNDFWRSFGESKDSITYRFVNSWEPEICEYNPQLLATDINCIPPVIEVCEYNPNLVPNDPNCLPPVPPCQIPGKEHLLANSAGCGSIITPPDAGLFGGKAGVIEVGTDTTTLKWLSIAMGVVLFGVALTGFAVVRTKVQTDLVE